MLATADSAWGPLHIAAGSSGVVGAGLLATRDGFVADLRRRGRGDLVPLEEADDGPARDHALHARAVATTALDGDVDAIDELARIPIDIADRPAWDRLVLEGVRTIPRGSVAGYGVVARMVGRPGAARAVGGAVARNPAGLFVPCHRVIAGDGSLGGYGAAAWGGVDAALDVKRGLLALEGVRLPR